MKVSIITTTYNQKSFLKETIESIQNSILIPFDDEWEHIIYDDASTDGTRELFDHHPWKNIIYIRSEKNSGGPSYGRNIALEKATGDYIFMIDHDDIILQRTLYNFLVEAKTYPEKKWFYADFLRADEALHYLPRKDYFGWDFKSTEEMLKAIFAGDHFMQSSVFIHKSLFAEAGGFDVARHVDQDLDMFVRFLLNGYLPKYCRFSTHIHRLHGSNLSGDMAHEEHLVKVQELRQKYLHELTLLGI